MLQIWNILLIEDDEDDCLILRQYLQEIPGREIFLHWAASYDEGMGRIAQGGFDICLLDYFIGRHTGLEFLEVIKEQGVQTPVVLLTGMGHREIDLAATEAGAVDFLDKSELSARMLERTIRYAIANAESMKALAEKTDFLETTLENTGAGIAAFDGRGVLTMSNRLFGAFMDRIDETMLCDPAAVTFEAVSNLLDLDPFCPVTVVCPKGKIFEVRVNNVPSGGAVIFVIDLSEQKALEETMTRARKDAQAASRTKSAFLSNISHELRTPLHSVIGYSDLIMSGTDALDPKDCAYQIHESGTHLLSLIESMLSYSKLESGTFCCKCEDVFEIDALIDSAVANVSVAASRRDISVSVLIDPTLTSLFCDQVALRQMLINLLNNAIEFSYEGQSVEVSLQGQENGSVCLCVRDHGIGMDPEKADTVCIPFVQLDDSLNRCHEGTGLGLSIVKALAAYHHATLHIETFPGEGTAVFIMFPPQQNTEGCSGIQSISA